MRLSGRAKFTLIEFYEKKYRKKIEKTFITSNLPFWAPVGGMNQIFWINTTMGSRSNFSCQIFSPELIVLKSSFLDGKCYVFASCLYSDVVITNNFSHWFMSDFDSEDWCVFLLFLISLCLKTRKLWIRWIRWIFGLFDAFWSQFSRFPLPVLLSMSAITIFQTQVISLVCSELSSVI